MRLTLHGQVDWVGGQFSRKGKGKVINVFIKHKDKCVPCSELVREDGGPVREAAKAPQPL